MRWRLVFSGLVLGALLLGWLSSRGDRPARDLPEVELPPPGGWDVAELPAGGRRLRGLVRRPDGTPAPDVAVVRRGAQRTSWTYTAQDGSFELSDLPEGLLVLDLCDVGHPPTSVEVQPGAQRVELELEPRRKDGPALVPPGTRSQTGLVLAPEGVVPAGWEVLFDPADPPESLDGARPRRARVDAGGEFEVPDLVHARYHVRVLPEWARGTRWPDLARASEPMLLPREDLRIETQAGSIAGRVTDPEDHPIEGALLLLRSTDEPGRLWPSEATDVSGAYAFADLPPGRYDLEVLAGEAQRWLAEIPVESGRTSVQDVPDLAVR